jgi:hypothetical protein
MTIMSLRVDSLRRTATACLWISRLVAVASVAAMIYIADYNESCGPRSKLCPSTATRFPHVGWGVLVLAVGLLLSVLFAAVSKIAFVVDDELLAPRELD